MELRNIVTFLQAAEMENFTHAANSLGYSQSTVTVQIKQLETELGYQLFDRVGNRISLTPRGEEFRYYANQLVSISQQIKLIPMREPENLPDYHKRFPNLTIQTRTGSSEELFSLLRHNELDVIFTLGQKSMERDCVRAYARESRICFTAAASSPYAGGEELRFEDVCRMPLILTERDSVYRRALEQAAALRDIEVSPVLEVDSTSAITSLVKIGLGVSLLPDYVVSPLEKRGEAVVLDVPDCSIRLWQQIFYHKNKWVTPQMAGLIEAIRTAYPA